MSRSERELAHFHPSRELRQRSECNICVIRRQRPRIDLRADESIVHGASLLSRQHRIPPCGRRERIGWRELARTTAPLIDRRHRRAPIPRCRLPIRRAHLHPHQLFRFGKGGNRHLGPHGRRSPERGRSPGRQLRFAARCRGSHQTNRRTTQKSTARFRHVFSEAIVPAIDHTPRKSFFSCASNSYLKTPARTCGFKAHTRYRSSDAVG